MRQSRLFTRTRHEAPSDEVSKNAQLLIRGGFIKKEMAGVYSYLPLGRRVLEKIEYIIREEMNALGGQEIRMATLHPAEPWKQTGAWDSVDVVFKIKSRTESEYTVGQSEEEIITPIAREYVLSHKDLPLAVYQIGQKYRDELRAKSGILRGREFTMKDMYSFHASQDDFDNFYQTAKGSYLKVFSRCGLTAKATEASGGNFTEKLSYEFMVLTDAGEDDIVYCDLCSHCANVEVSKEKAGDTCPRCLNGSLAEARASEVGNIFDLGMKYAKDFNFTYKDAQGNEQYPIMGCFGIGVTRLMGVIVEKFSDDKGIWWPLNVAPFKVHLVGLNLEDPETRDYADGIYNALNDNGIETLYDDRDARAGEKFADSDLIGIPYRVIISKRTRESGLFEVITRKTGEVRNLTEEELYQDFNAVPE